MKTSIDVEDVAIQAYERYMPQQISANQSIRVDMKKAEQELRQVIDRLSEPSLKDRLALMMGKTDSDSFASRQMERKRELDWALSCFSDAAALMECQSAQTAYLEGVKTGIRMILDIKDWSERPE